MAFRLRAFSLVAWDLAGRLVTPGVRRLWFLAVCRTAVYRGCWFQRHLLIIGNGFHENGIRVL